MSPGPRITKSNLSKQTDHHQRSPLLIKAILTAALLVMTLLTVEAAVPEDLPDAEKSIANTVDPWGLPFSDQLTRFRGRFEEAPAANFCVGITHDLVKIWPNKSDRPDRPSRDYLGGCGYNCCLSSGDPAQDGRRTLNVPRRLVRG